MASEKVAKLTILILALTLVVHTKKIHVSIWRNSEPVKNLTGKFYEIWGSPFKPVDLSQLNNFDGGDWLISVTNFLNLDLVGIIQPLVVRHPILAVINYDEYEEQHSILIWAFDSRGDTLTIQNHTWQVQEISTPYCLIHFECAVLPLDKLTLKSKLWNSQLRLDLFPPHLDIYWRRDTQPPFDNYYKNMLLNPDFGFPFLWSLNNEEWVERPIIVSQIPLLHISMFPYMRWVFAFDKAWVYMPLSYDREYKHISDMANVHFLIVNLVENRNNMYSPDGVYYISQFYNGSELVETDVRQLAPDPIFKLLQRFWKGQMHWVIGSEVEQISKYFESCVDHSKHLSATKHARLSAEEILYLAVAQLWHSMFHNYTSSIIGQGDFCINGRIIPTYFGEIKYFRIFLISSKYLGHFLHVPMQIFDRANGSFRFVVCGTRGSEGVAFRELVSVYDKFVWTSLAILVSCAAIMWTFLLSTDMHLACNALIRVDRNAFLGKLYSLLKILLEQGELTPGGMSTSTQKVRVFLGIVLLMCIIISNGYKNASVYNMVLPRKHLRYETFNDLIEANFSIYTTSIFEFDYLPYHHPEKNWSAIEFTTHKISNHEYKINYFSDNIDYSFISWQAVTEPVVNGMREFPPSPYMETQEIEHNKLIHSRTHV